MAYSKLEMALLRAGLDHDYGSMSRGVSKILDHLDSGQQLSGDDVFDYLATGVLEEAAVDAKDRSQFNNNVVLVPNPDSPEDEDVVPTEGEEF